MPSCSSNNIAHQQLGIYSFSTIRTTTAAHTAQQLQLQLRYIITLIVVVTILMLQGAAKNNSVAAAAAFAPQRRRSSSSSSSSFRSSSSSSSSVQQTATVQPTATTTTRPQQQQQQQQQEYLMKQQQQQHLVLIGGGHAHVQVVKALNAACRPAHVKVTLIDRLASATYSGTVPGCIAGLYDNNNDNDGSSSSSSSSSLLHLEPLAAWAGIQFIRGTVVDIDLEKKLIFLLPRDGNDGDDDEQQKQRQPQPQPPILTITIPFDVVSMDIGSTSGGMHSCVGAAAYSIPTRPIHELIRKLDAARLDLLLQQQQQQQQLIQQQKQHNGDEQQTQDQQQQRIKLVVIGGGAAGIELAMAVTSRWQRELAAAASAAAVDDNDIIHCTVLDAGDQLLIAPAAAAAATPPPLDDENDNNSNASPMAQQQETIRSVLQSKNILVRHGCRVTKIDESVIHVVSVLSGDDVDATAATATTTTTGAKEAEETTVVPYTHCIWAAGAGAHRLAWHLSQQRGLATDKNGWICVHATLQSTSHPHVFAAGDCASISSVQEEQQQQQRDGISPLPMPMRIPKAGVYAVRAGPILIENLTRYLDSIRSDDKINDNNNADGHTASPSDVKLIPYVPQDDFLKLIGCGDGTALGFRFGLVMQGKWVFDLKDNIDRSFMKLFDVSDLAKPVADTVDHNEKVGKYDTRQYDIASNEQSIPLLEPDEAALLLQRTDDGVDFRQAQLVLRAMGSDAAYRDAVLQQHHLYQHNARTGAVNNAIVSQS